MFRSLQYTNRSTRQNFLNRDGDDAWFGDITTINENHAWSRQLAAPRMRAAPCDVALAAEGFDRPSAVAQWFISLSYPQPMSFT